jgi:hypothetical protein
MFDTLESGSGPDGISTFPGDGGPAPVPLERLEAEI